MKNRNRTRRFVEHVKFGIINKTIKKIIYRKNPYEDRRKKFIESNKK